MNTLSSPPAALVTGGSKGIGFGIARMLASRGWNLTLAARNIEGLKVAQGRLSEFGTEILTISCDVSDEEQNKILVESHVTKFKVLDALVLAAGVGSAGSIVGYSSRRLDLQYNVNFRAPFLLTSAALPALRATALSREDGVSRVIVLSSLGGIYPEAGLPAYSATKAAVISLVNSINLEERTNGVIATAISPGFVNTDMSDWVAEEIPKDTMISVDDIASCVALLLDVSPQCLLPHLIIHRRSAKACQA